MSALGLSSSINGVRLLPIATLYDPFISRALDQLNYACYQDARFMVAATPSGITLAPEGGAHQSIATPLIGIAQDGLAAFEPAFVDELAVIMGWGFAHMQRELNEEGDEQSGMRSGGSVYLRLSTRSIDQPQRMMTPDLQKGITDGAYWLRKPGPNAEVVIAYTGAVAPEAIEAIGLLGESRRDVGLLAITSADRLHAGWTAARKIRRDNRGSKHMSHIEKLLAPLPRDCGIVTVIDGHPATLGWLGSVRGHRARGVGRRAFRPDRHHRRPLPPSRHGRQRHHRRGGRPHRRRAGAASQDGGVSFLFSLPGRAKPALLPPYAPTLYSRVSRNAASRVWRVQFPALSCKDACRTFRSPFIRFRNQEVHDGQPHAVLHRWRLGRSRRQEVHARRQSGDRRSDV